MKSFLSLVILASMFLATSCSNSSKAITADLVSGVFTTATVTTLDCQAVDVVKADISASVNKWFSVQANEQKGIVKNLCTTAISEIVPTLIGTTIPATWNCKITKLDNAASVLATAACASIPN